MLTKIHVQNYRYYERYALDFNKGLNILVGDNDSGKSTLLEAIGLALTGRVAGRTFATELSPFHFNSVAVAAYCDALRAKQEAVAPEIVIDLFMEKNDDTAKLQGTNNVLGEDSPGVRVRVYPDPDLTAEFLEFLKPNRVCGVTQKLVQRVRGSRRLAAARNTRSRWRISGRPTCRCAERGAGGEERRSRGPSSLGGSGGRDGRACG